MKDKKIGSILKTESKVIAYVVICLVIIVLGISYALFFEVKGNEKNQIVKAGTLEFTYANGSQITNTTNSECFIPMSEEEALKHGECEYKISIRNAGTLPGSYNISLSSETVDKPLALNKLKVILKKEGQVVADYPKEGTTTSLVENEKIEAGKIINYSVQVYVDADNELLNADDDEKNISIKINGDAVVNSEEVNPKNSVLAINYIKNLLAVESGDGLYTVKHEDSDELDPEWNKMEYRYGGANPNNFVKFNDEIWRIIGLVNVKTSTGIQQRVKIVRQDGIKTQKDFGQYSWDYKTNGNGSSNSSYGSNDWTDSQLKDTLNGIYFNSGKDFCIHGGNLDTNCDFSGNGREPKGLDEIARNMVDKNVIWNLGSWDNLDITANEFYYKERGKKVYTEISRQTEWSQTTDVGNKHNGIGLIYPSDYGFAVGGSVRDICLTKNISNYNKDDCGINNWLKPSSGNIWTLTQSLNGSFYAYILTEQGGFGPPAVSQSFNVWPALYLDGNIKISLNSQSDKVYGSIDNPFVLS